MGGTTSTTKGTADLLDVENCGRFNNLSKEVQGYAQEMGDCFLGFYGMLEGFFKKFDKRCMKYMTPDERAKFLDLESQKTTLVSEVSEVVGTEAIRFRRFGKRAKVGSNVSELLAGVDAQGQIDRIAKLKNRVDLLQQEYTAFREMLEEACSKDGRNRSHFIKLIMGIGTLIAGLTCLVLFIVHLAAAPVLAPGYIVGLVVGSTLCVATAVACFQKDELQRARDYIADIQVKLNSLYTAMKVLQSHQKSILSDELEVKEFKDLCEELCNRCKQVETACDEVRKSQFT